MNARRLVLSAALCLLAVDAGAQVYSNRADRFRKLANLPATCKVADVVTDWDAVPPTAYMCTAEPGTWTAFTMGGGAAGANEALSNLVAVAINESLVSDTDNTDALGTLAKSWSDLVLGNGSVITWLSAPSTSDLTLTHSAELLTLAGGTLRVTGISFVNGSFGINRAAAGNDLFFFGDQSTGDHIWFGDLNGTMFGKIGIDTAGVTTWFKAPLLSSLLVEANTAGSGAPNIILATESGTTFNNTGAAAQNYHQLPAAAAGLHYRWVVTDADGIRVTAVGDDTIRQGATVSGAAGFIQCSTIGCVLDLESQDGTQWFVTSVMLTWTIDS